MAHVHIAVDAPSTTFFHKFHKTQLLDIPTCSHPGDQNLLKPRGTSTESPTGGELPFDRLVSLCCSHQSIRGILQHHLDCH